MSDFAILIFGMFVFALAIGSSLITVLGGNVTPVERSDPPAKKTGASSGTDAVVAAGNG